jgi:hypothetical protein
MEAPPLIVCPGRPWQASRLSPLRDKFLFRDSINLYRPKAIIVISTVLIRVDFKIVVRQKSNQ